MLKRKMISENFTAQHHLVCVCCSFLTSHLIINLEMKLIQTKCGEDRLHSELLAALF